MKLLKCDRCDRRSDEVGWAINFFHTDVEFTVDKPGYGIKFDAVTRTFDLCRSCYQGVVLATTRALRKESQG